MHIGNDTKLILLLILFCLFRKRSCETTDNAINVDYGIDRYPNKEDNNDMDSLNIDAETFERAFDDKLKM